MADAFDVDGEAVKLDAALKMTQKFYAANTEREKGITFNFRSAEMKVIPFPFSVTIAEVVAASMQVAEVFQHELLGPMAGRGGGGEAKVLQDCGFEHAGTLLGVPPVGHRNGVNTPQVTHRGALVRGSSRQSPLVGSCRLAGEVATGSANWQEN
jgi:hypothetical protein